jgi:hypothetical protein
VNILWRCKECVCHSGTASTFCDLGGLYLSLVGYDLVDCTAGQNAQTIDVRFSLPLDWPKALQQAFR